MKALFIGGCLFTTKTVEKEERFVNVLLSRNPGLQIDLARYSAYSLVDEILSTQFSERTPDCVLFLVRPFPFFTLCKMFPRVPETGGGTQVKVHPGLFGGENREWFRENDRLIVEKDWNPNGTKRSYTHGVNLSLGEIFKLEAWAIGYVKRKILDMNALCKQKNIRFIVICPPAVLNDKQEGRLLSKLNKELIVLLNREKLSHINLFSEDFPETMLGPDKVHYTPQGHFQLSKKIEEKLF